MDNNSSYTKKEGQGTLFKNDKKTSPNQPDFTGSIMVGGVEKRIAAWTKTARNGGSYLSLSISDFQGGQQGQGQERAGTTSGHEACDEFIQIFRQQMKKFHGDDCTERHTYYDKIRPGKKRVVILKQTAGQGAMYDTHLFGHEPSGALGSRSVIDMGNMPILVSPNEYRDGIIRSMQ